MFPLMLLILFDAFLIRFPSRFLDHGRWKEGKRFSHSQAPILVSELCFSHFNTKANFLLLGPFLFSKLCYAILFLISFFFL